MSNRMARTPMAGFEDPPVSCRGRSSGVDAATFVFVVFGVLVVFCTSPRYAREKVNLALPWVVFVGSVWESPKNSPRGRRADLFARAKGGGGPSRLLKIA